MKHKRFYMVINPGNVNYVKLESEWIIRKTEGEDILKKSNPDATEIKLLNKKTIKLLNLK